MRRMITRRFLHLVRAVGTASGIAAVVVGCAGDGVDLAPILDLAHNQARWEAVGPDSYVYAMEWLCFCPVEYRGPVRITVEEGVAVERAYVESGDPVPEDLAAGFPAVDGLFERLASAMQDGAYLVDVTYDPDLGMPLEFWIDPREEVADDELGMTVSEAVTPIP
jgi:hypothetical protein